MNLSLITFNNKIMTLRKLYKADPILAEPSQGSASNQSIQNIRDRQRYANRFTDYRSEFKCLDSVHSFLPGDQQVEERSPEFYTKEQTNHPFQDVEIKFSFNQEWESQPNTYRSKDVHQGPQRTSEEKQKDPLKDQPFQGRDHCWKESNQTSLCQIQNSMINQRKGSVGSIKKNKKVQETDNIFLCSEFFKNDFDLEEIENIRMSKLTEMNQKLNRVINKEKLGQVPQQNKENYCRQDNRVLNSRKEYNQPKPRSDYSLNVIYYLQLLFQRLDSSKVGRLSKNNCDVKGIPEEFKFIFGAVFTKIIFKGFNCDQQQFQKLCLSSLKDTDLNEIQELFENKLRKEHKRADPSESTNKVKDPFLTESQTSKKCIDSQSLQIKEEINSTLLRQGKKRYYEIEEPPLAARIAKEIDLEPLERKYYSCSKTKGSPHQDHSQNSFNHKQRKIGISESILVQHKNSLRELDDLDKMVSRCLNTHQLSKQNEFDGQSLSFGELVKHI